MNDVIRCINTTVLEYVIVDDILFIQQVTVIWNCYYMYW